MASTQLTFGTALWDNLGAIEAYNQEGQEFLARFSDFVKKRAQIQVTYARDIQKLVDSFREPAAKKKKRVGAGVDVPSTVQLGWASLLDNTHDIAKVHIQSAQFMDTEMVAMIRSNMKSTETEHKQNVADVRALKVDLKKVLDQLDASKRRYEQSCKIADDACAAFEKADKDLNVTKGMVEKLKRESADKTKASEEADIDYQKTLQLTNDRQKEHYYTLLPKSLNALQATEESRVEFIKTLMSKYASLLLNELPDITKHLSAILDTAQKVNKAEDSLQLIIVNKSTDRPPGPIAYANYYNSPNSRKSVTKARPAQDSELLDTMPPEKAIKRCHKRVQELTREIQEADNKRIGLETLVDAFIAQDEMSQTNAMDEAAQQLDDIENKLDELRLKKFKYEEFLANLEGRPAPEEPSLYSDQKPAPPPGAVSIREQVLGKNAKKLFALGQSMASMNSQPSDQNLSSSQRFVQPLPSTKEVETTAPASAPAQSAVATPPAVSHTPKSRVSTHQREPVAKQYKTMYAFNGDRAQEELPFKANELLTVLEKEEEWWLARNAAGDEGYVPHNYLAEIA